MEAASDILIGIAEIGAAFAGFPALAAVFGHRSDPSAQHDIERLRTVVYSSLFVVIAAFVPILFGRYGLSDSAAWRVSSAVVLAFNWVLVVVLVRLGHRSGLHKADKLYTRIGYSVEVGIELALIANVLNLFPAQAAALFLTFLVGAIFQAGLAFLLLLNSLFTRSSDAG